ncbi:hypothetical protein PF008_g31570 [Phytophthora fragariae]|uniref:Reverse transcriptase RNase H-like domain-containing protein n=1 Tax=Phytophthora fragariae TaxID=53985 RepID=A0A6G0Q2D7_9STRA|nr:hypothetical protein PF008_g31570 [Phytophthora fragariae]
MTRPNLAGRLHRWSLTLQEYEFTIEYRPGTTNVVVDALSRAPVAVRAVVGRKRRPGRPLTRTTRTDSAAEAKTEDDEPVRVIASGGDKADEAATTAAAALKQTTNEEAGLRRTAETAAPAPTTAANVRLGASGEGDDLSKGGTQWPTDRPLTRAAKRRQEEAAATVLGATNSLPQLARQMTADGEGDRPPHQPTAGGEHTATRPLVATKESRTADATGTATGQGSAAATEGSTALPATAARALSPVGATETGATTAASERPPAGTTTDTALPKPATTPLTPTVATAQSSAVSPRSAVPAYDTVTQKSGKQPRRTTRAGNTGATRTAPRSTKKRKARRTTDAVEVPASAVPTLGQAGAARTAPGETLDEGDELAPAEPTLQVTDEEVMNAQQHSKLVQRLL